MRTLRAADLLLLLTATSLAGCLSGDEHGTDPADAAPPARLSVEAWRALLSEPRFDAVTETVVGLTAEDGTHLSLSLYLPEGLPAGERVPTLMELTPYQTLDRGLNALAAEPDAGGGWQEMVLRGMAFVRADARGTHGSAGCLDFGGEADRSDARLFLDWVRAQPWSDGRVVTDGVSHPGMGSVVAHVADPDLTAAIATAPVVSYYMDEWFQGAKYDNQANGPAYQAIELLPATTTEPEDHVAQAAPCTGKTATDYGLDGTWGPMWQERDLALTMEASLAEGAGYGAPILLNHGFVDLNVQPDHSQLYWDALPDDHPKSLIMGWWYHSWPDLDGHPAEHYADVRQRFFDHHLLGIDNGWEAEPRVLVEDSTGVWHESHDWPLDGSAARTFWTADDALSPLPVPGAPVSYADPLPHEQDAASGRVRFRSAPMAETTLVNGQPVVDLVATSDAEETKWVAFLLDEAPDGGVERISHGASDSHRRHDRDEGWAPVTPGEPETWSLKLLPTAYVLEEGHRLVLEVSSQESNQLRGGERRCWDDHRGGSYCPNGILPATTAGQATNTVLTGPDGTRVTVHLVDPAATVKPA